ncbi:dienelactone hydrolase family protein [Enterococcus sp. AZ196]|uniref:dienelactone hydrolase family protein n=1 Tax=Enterococcus sp. AZ196 TaxID=2774659 RepID=UPI003D2CC865
MSKMGVAAISKAILILHEIYGVNDFINDQIHYFDALGFHVYCPNLLKRPAFSYQEAEAAYNYFYSQDHSEMQSNISNAVDRLSRIHEAVFVIGYSVGGTLAWLCSDNINCTGVIACYGSRIRDHVQLMPKCKTLLLFSQEAGFSVRQLASKLANKPTVFIREFNAAHGFLDPSSANYCEHAAKEAQREILRFLQ